MMTAPVIIARKSLVSKQYTASNVCMKAAQQYSDSKKAQLLGPGF
jgi:hypothetical protein